jgi:hypothetical protein
MPFGPVTNFLLAQTIFFRPAKAGPHFRHWMHLLEKYHKDLNAIESPTNTSTALVEIDLLPEVDATETESPINTSSTLVENDLL